MAGPQGWIGQAKRLFGGGREPLAPRLSELVLLEQDRRCRKQMPILHFSIIMSAIAAGVAAEYEAAPFYRTVVGPAIVLFCLARLALWFRSRHEVPTPAQAAHALRRRLVIVCLIVVPVTAWTIFAYTVTEPLVRTLIPVFLALGSFGVAIGFASHPPAALMPLVLGVLPVSLILLSAGEPHAVGLGLALLTVLALQFGLVLSGYRDMIAGLRLQDEMHQQARTDSLTGVLNRRALLEELDAAIDPDDEERSPALILLDLNGFKPVNDRFGHAAGDELLRAVTERLRTHETESVLVARLGGDEFAILVQGEKRNSVSLLADQLLASLAHPYMIEGRRLMVSASLGYALPGEGQSPHALIASADQALYAAKDMHYAAMGRHSAPSGLPYVRQMNG